MKVKTIELFNFDELTKDAQQKAVEKLNDINVDYEEWSECIIEDFKAQLEFMGFYDIDCFYSGFWNQGDGASFSAKYSYLKGGLKKLKEYSPNDSDILQIATKLQKWQKMYFYNIRATIKQDGRYYHSNTMSIDEFYGANEDVIFLNICKNLADILYSRLRDSYSYLTSEEAIIETIKANEYYFTVYGDLE